MIVHRAFSVERSSATVNNELDNNTNILAGDKRAAHAPIGPHSHQVGTLLKRNTQHSVAWNQRGRGRGPGENNLKATSESYSGNVSNQDTTSKQHHSRTEITTKNTIDHICFQNKIFFFFFFHTEFPLRRKTISSRLISLYPQWTISCHVTAFLYWISPGLHLLNTNT